MANHAETIKDLTIETINKPGVIGLPDGRTFIVRPSGPGSYQVEDRTLPHQVETPTPKYVQQLVNLHTVASLVDYVSRFKQGNTAIFADLDREVVHAAIDYHGPGVGPDVPGLRSHNATLQLRKSEQWTLWLDDNDSMQAQDDFAEFLTENAPDIILPEDWGNLYEIILDLQGEQTVRVARRLKRAHSGSGTGGVQVEKNVTDLPPEIVVRIPVYFGESPIDIRTFLRDDVKPSGLELGYRMVHTERIRQAELTRIAREIGEATSCPVFIGKC